MPWAMRPNSTGGTAINYGAENIGFAVPVNTLRDILPQLRDKGKVSRGYLGIEIQNLDYARAQAFGRDTTEGALVGNVQSGTPAAGAVIVCSTCAPSMLLTVPSSCPSATASPGPTAGSHQPSSSQRSHRKRRR